MEFITCFGGDSDPEGLNGSARKKKKKKKKRGKKVYREPIGRKLRQSCVQNYKHVFRISVRGSGTFIPDPNFFHPGSWIRIKEFKYFNPIKWFPNSRKYDLGCSSRIPDPDPDFLPIPDPDPQHCLILKFFLFES